MFVTSPEFFGYLRQMLAGLLVTVELFCLGFALALSSGVILGFVTLSRNRIVQLVWRVYASIVMGVPSLLVIFLIYYGGGAMLNGLLGRFGITTTFDVTPFGAGIASLALVYAAYVAELVRGAVGNVPRGQFEASSSLAIPRLVTWWHIVLPQVLRLSLPGIVNIWLVVLKDTSLVSLAGLNDFVAISKTAAGATKEPFIFFIVASLFYVVFSAATMPLARLLESRFNRGYGEIRR